MFRHNFQFWYFKFNFKVDISCFAIVIKISGLFTPHDKRIVTSNRTFLVRDERFRSVMNILVRDVFNFSSSKSSSFYLFHKFSFLHLSFIFKIAMPYQFLCGSPVLKFNFARFHMVHQVFSSYLPSHVFKV